MWPQGFRARDCGRVITYLPNNNASHPQGPGLKETDTKGVQETNGANVIGLVFSVTNDTIYSLIKSESM